MYLPVTPVSYYDTVFSTRPLQSSRVTLITPSPRKASGHRAGGRGTTALECYSSSSTKHSLQTRMRCGTMLRRNQPLSCILWSFSILPDRQSAHTNLPQLRQWWRRVKIPNGLSHSRHTSEAWSGHHRGVSNLPSPRPSNSRIFLSSSSSRCSAAACAFRSLSDDST